MCLSSEMWLRCNWDVIDICLRFWLRWNWCEAEMELRSCYCVSVMCLNWWWYVVEKYQRCGWDITEMQLIFVWVVVDVCLICEWDVGGMIKYNWKDKVDRSEWESLLVSYLVKQQLLERLSLKTWKPKAMGNITKKALTRLKKAIWILHDAWVFTFVLQIT